MRYFIHVLLLLAFTACAAPGPDQTVMCPDSSVKGLSHEQWLACFGRQDKDASGSR